ncbi:MAG: delta-aminolevulinic acid dehydratase [Bacteroidetes bacterium]|nr:delta-aminolevulinic acid dehydratase [Bacteroidota bacterium]
MYKEMENSFKQLEAYCEQEAYKGWDPYDGLNSTLFNAVPGLSKSRMARLAWIQTFKRSPINLRKLTGVKKDYNPKALGLFLSSYCTLYTIEPKEAYMEKIYFFAAKIQELQSSGWSGACWGYNFDWQARAFFQPKYTPTVVASVFIGSALLDAYEITKEERLLKMARSTCNFILKDLNRTADDKGNFAFSYSPLDKSVVFNASLLGSRLLARVYSFTKEQMLIDEAKKSVAFCSSYQKEDGSWGYGTLPFHQWIDNFHTGYNLECIYDYMKYSGDHSYEEVVKKGYDYYIKTFFTNEGVPKYYSNSVYPIDVHAPAQMIVTVAKLGTYAQDKAEVNKVLEWTIKNMQSNKGYFYYQVNKYFSSKIPYMRWAQAWMFYALTTYLKLEYHEQN